MKFKDYLASLEWNSFERYPEQYQDIYVQCSAAFGTIRQFVKVKMFNAVSFNANNLVRNHKEKHDWEFSWLPADKIEREYDKSTAD